MRDERGFVTRVGDREVQEDWVVGDVDGVVIVPGAAIDDVIAAGRARAQHESRYFELLRSGSTTVEILALDPSPVTVALPRVP